MPYLRMDVGVSMGAFGEKIKKRREELGLSLLRLGEKAKIYRSDHPGKAVSSSYIKDIEKNNKIPSEPIIVALAKALDLDYRQLLVDARLEKAPNAAVEDIYKEIFGYTPSPGTTLNTDKQYQIPLIPYASQSDQATEYAGLDLWELPIFDAGMGEPSGWSDHGYPLGFASEYVAMPKKDIDTNSFAVRCHGDSMEPTLFEGDTVVVVPSAQLINGKLCFATWWQDERGDRLVKRYRKHGDIIFLESDNRDYDPIILTPENGKGVKIFRVTKLLRDNI